MNDGTGQFRAIRARRRASGRRACRTPVGAPPGSTSTTTGGSTSSRSTARSSRNGGAAGAVRFRYDQRKLLFRNLGDGRFEDVTGEAGAVFELSEAGRGAAFGDIDNDGDVDVLVGNDCRPRPPADQPDRQPQPLARAAAGGTADGRPRHARRARRRSSAAAARRSGAAPDPMAATRRRTIRACSSGLGESAGGAAYRGAAGPMAATRSGPTSRSIDGPR